MNKLLHVSFFFLVIGTAWAWNSGIISPASPGPVATAAFENPVFITEENWNSGHLRLACTIVSSEQLHLIGVRVPCPCLSTPDLPMEIEAGSNVMIVFDLDLARLEGTPAGEMNMAEIEFLADNQRHNATAGLLLVPEIPLIKGE